MHLNQYVYNTPFGPVTITAEGGYITHVFLGSKGSVGGNPTSVTNSCANQLLEYFAGKRMVFDLPINPVGTDFQMKVWQALLDIPYAQTRTPLAIAEQIGAPSSYRLVSRAAFANPISIVVPSHRLYTTSDYNTQDKAAKLRAACRQLEQHFS